MCMTLIESVGSRNWVAAEYDPRGHGPAAPRRHRIRRGRRDTRRRRLDAGIHFVMESFNARATLVYFNERPSNRNVKNTNGVTLAMQIQF